MNNLEKVLAEYHKYLMLRKLGRKEHAPYLAGVGYHISAYSLINKWWSNQPCAGLSTPDYGQPVFVSIGWGLAYVRHPTA